MPLELCLNLETPHQFHYYNTGNEPEKLKTIFKKDNSIQYVIDNCILSRPCDLVKSMNRHFNSNLLNMDLVEYLLKSTYGQTKAIVEIAQKGHLLITEKILTEFNNSQNIFELNYLYLLKHLEQSPNKNYKLKLAHCLIEEMDKLRSLTQISTFKDERLLDLMTKEFKKTPFYLETITRHNRTKQISDSDLGIFLLASGQNTYSEDFSETKLITNDFDILHQGAPFIGDTLLKSPEILKPNNYMKKYGRFFYKDYFSLKQPKITKKKAQKIIEHHKTQIN
jgi:hypothetical protein